jgi:hypothetical protein
MPTFRKMYNGIYTEVKRVVNGEVKQTCCCCKAAGMSRRECADAHGNKWPCRCYCHSKKF